MKRRDGSKFKANYIEIPATPDLERARWNPAPGSNHGDARYTTLYTIGGYYKLVRDRHTGEVAYYQRKNTPEACVKSPTEKLDHEPRPPKQVRYRVGTHCWFVHEGSWFCVKVEHRTRAAIRIRPTTGWDAERTRAWPHPEVLEFSPKSALFDYLRPLKARQA